jgi:hypothetical protein
MPDKQQSPSVREEPREFHLAHGLCFRLESDSSVKIVRRAKAHDPETLLVSIDAASWDSIVAFTRGGGK